MPEPAVPPTNLKWTYTAASAIVGAPAIAVDGTIYFADFTGTFYALSPAGVLLWSLATIGGAESVSSPIYGPDGTVYFSDIYSRVYAVTPSSTAGSYKWTFSLGGGGSFGSPALSRDATAVYVHADDGNLHAIDASTGAPKWVFNPLVYPNFGTSVSSPAVAADGTIYYGGFDAMLYAVYPNGTLRWSYKLGALSFSSPAIGADGTVYIGCYDTKLYAVSASGILRWTFASDASGGVYSSPVVDASGTIYFSDGAATYAVSPTGSRLWKDSNSGGTCNVEGAPVVGVGVLYLGCDDGRLLTI